METPSALTKRTWCYLLPPTAFGVSACPCGHAECEWSEFDDHLWCSKCERDFIPEHWGLFDGPVPMHATGMLGIHFHRRNLITEEVELYDTETGTYTVAAEAALSSVSSPVMPDSTNPVTPPFSLDQLRLALAEAGWRMYQERTEMWYKRFEGRQCLHNTHRPGMQVGFSISFIEEDVVFSLRVCAEKTDNIWVNLSVYAFSDPTVAFIESQALQLIAGWNAMYDASRV